MKALIRVLKSEKLRVPLLLLLLIFNSAIFSKISAAAYVGSASACNVICVTDESVSPQSVSTLNGFIGNFMNQLCNGIVCDYNYSTGISECGADCDSLEKLNVMLDSGKLPTKFSAVNALADANVALLNERPLSTVDYVQDKVYALTHFNTVSAQAAVTPDGKIASRDAYYSPGGTGFSLLKPIQNFWSWSVRVVYGFLIVIVIIIAFAIMFRQRLSGSVEVTVQNAIPAIALAMILVPLSYAISGLFIDVITVGTNAVHEFFIGTNGSPGNELYTTSGAADNLYKDPITDKVYDDRGYYPDDIRVDWLRARDHLNVAPQVGAVARSVGKVTGLNGNVIFLAVGSIVNAIAGKSSESPTTFTWIGDVVQFFISIVTLWIGVQIFIALFKKYMTIILYPVLSPFIFATVAVPGNGTKSVMQYIKVMGAASLAFIVTYAMFLLSIIFTSKSFLASVPTFASASFNPPLIGLKSIGVGDNEMTQLLLTLIGLGIYFSIPATLKSLDKALGADSPLPKFITTPLDSFRESQKVMFKTAPALAGRVAGTAGSLAGNAGAVPFRAYSGSRDLLDRARGIDPEKDYRSYRNRQRAARQDNAKAIEERRQQSQQSSNPFARMAGNARAGVSNATNNLAGQISGTGSSLPSDVSRPKVAVSGNDVSLNRSDVLARITDTKVGVQIRARTIDYSRYTGTAVAIGSGTLEFKVEANGVTLAFPPKLVFGTIKPKSTARSDQFVPDVTFTNDAARNAALASLKYKDSFQKDAFVSSPTILRIELDGAPKASGVDTVKQDFLIMSNNLSALFGSTNGGNNAASFVPIDPAAVMRSGREFKISKDLFVKINDKDDFMAIPFNIKVRLQ